MASTCKSACSGPQDYCTMVGYVTSTECTSCFDQYTASGATCDPTTGSIATACSGSSDCTAYLACANGCK